MSIKGWLSAVEHRLRSQKPARRRPVYHLSGLHDWLLEDRCLLSGSPIPFPVDPTTNQINTVSSLSDVFYTGASGQYAKTITITNNSSTQTIYPFLEGQNSLQAVVPYQGTGGYDPYDPINQEYRGYIGYTDGTNDYAGVPPNSSITITVPLVFWDSGRILFSTDGADQFQTFSGNVQSGINPNPTGAPFYYLNANTQAIYYCTIAAGDNKLYFTPADNSFQNGMPSTSAWQSPVASGVLKNGQQFIVTGPDSFSQVVTMDSSHPNYVSLPQSFSTAETAQQFVFTSSSNQTISTTARYLQNGFALSTQGSPSTNGLVMWYHALSAQAPNNDAPFQLTEVTFRGTFYNPQNNPGTDFADLLGGLKSAAYLGAITNSADYDVSYVDSINMPVAMEASNAMIPNTSTQGAFGWVGSGQSLEAFQSALVDFTTKNQNGNNTNWLATYFNGNGYPSYLVIDKGNVKLPSGQNLFLASPAAGGVADIKFFEYFPNDKPQPSSINAFQNALTSGPSGPTQLIIGGDGTNKSSGSDLYLSTNTQANVAALNIIDAGLKQNDSYNVTYNGNTLLGQVQSVIFQNNTPVGVVLKNATVPANAGSQVYTFSLVQTDLAASPIASLWYSWAQYYANSMNSVQKVSNVSGTAGAIVQNPDGSTTDNSNILTLTALPQGANLVPGMTVSGTDIPNGCVVLAVSSDQKTVTLSTALSPNQTYTNLAFSPPTFSTSNPASNSIVGYDPVYTPLVPLDFSKASPANQVFAQAFAQTVYVVMSAWSASVEAGPNTKPAWDQLLTNVIGGNLNSLYLPHANENVRNFLTDMSKSALRGVPDFTSSLYSDPSQWYPDPALATGGQSYNVYNLDPFVWFVHGKLGITAYAFALDDDVGNVNAGGATNVAISVGGLAGLTNQDPFTNTEPWGVVQAAVSTQENQSSSTITNINNPGDVFNQLAGFDYAHQTPGTLVNGPGVQIGTYVQFTSINQNASLSTLTLSNPLTANAPNGSNYAFFGPLVFTGTVLGPIQDPSTIILDNPAAAATLAKLGPLANIQVTGEGIDPNKPTTIEGVIYNLITKQTTVTLSNPLSLPTYLQNTYYAYTFGNPAVPVIRDPGFEWINTQNVTDSFLHGANLSATVPDWIFTDSKTNTSWYAGITANGSTYTPNNQSAPQGLQVGFIQGDSNISTNPKSTPVTLASGNYTLSLLAAQSADNQPQTSQSLNVMIDGKSVGTVTPSGTTYQQFTLKFTVGAGQHTIGFQGTDTKNASTVLIDSVALSSSSSLSSSPPPVSSLPPVGSPSPVSSTVSSNAPPTFQEFAQLAANDFLLTLNQVLAAAERALGFVPGSALESSIASYQNSISANPAAQTLLGQVVILFTRFETLNIVSELLESTLHPVHHEPALSAFLFSPFNILGGFYGSAPFAFGRLPFTNPMFGRAGTEF